MCLVIILTSVMVANATVFVDMNTVNDYINGTGTYAAGGGGGRHRWNGELTVKMRLAVAAFALAQGITFDNPATSNAILDFYNDLSEIDRKKIHAISELIDNVEYSYKVIASVSKDVADFMTGLISAFFTRERYFSDSCGVDYGQSVSFNGQSYINLSQDEQIFITTQSVADPSPNNPNCHVDYQIAGFSLRCYYHSYWMPPELCGYFNNDNHDSWGTFLIPDDGDLFYRTPNDVVFTNNDTYYNLAFNQQTLRLAFKSMYGGSDVVLRFDTSCFYSKSSYRQDNMIVYNLFSDSSGTYFLGNDYSIYKNLIFSDKIAALNYFFGQGNMSIDSDFEVHEIDRTPDVIYIDEDTQTDFVNQVDNMSDDDVITIVIPTSTTYNNFVNDPSLLFDFSQDNLYDSALNLPASDGNKWANKFPFCIPFDVYHLISNFYAEPEAPTFHFVVMPANSFGMNNEEFSLDIDFAPYNTLVQIMRFFMAAGFVLWLMSKTKDLMQ